MRNRHIGYNPSPYIVQHSNPKEKTLISMLTLTQCVIYLLVADEYPPDYLGLILWQAPYLFSALSILSGLHGRTSLTSLTLESFIIYNVLKAGELFIFHEPIQLMLPLAIKSLLLLCALGYLLQSYRNKNPERQYFFWCNMSGILLCAFALEINYYKTLFITNLLPGTPFEGLATIISNFYFYTALIVTASPECVSFNLRKVLKSIFTITIIKYPVFELCRLLLQRTNNETVDLSALFITIILLCFGTIMVSAVTISILAATTPNRLPYKRAYTKDFVRAYISKRWCYANYEVAYIARQQERIASIEEELHQNNLLLDKSNALIDEQMKIQLELEAIIQ